MHRQSAGQSTPRIANSSVATVISFFAHTGGQLTATEGTILHLWHGDHQNRRYSDRSVELISLGFDPRSDLRPSDSGAWDWNSDKLRFIAGPANTSHPQRRRRIAPTTQCDIRSCSQAQQVSAECADMSPQPESFVSQALIARAHHRSSHRGNSRILDDCDEDEAVTWNEQLAELSRALQLIDEQVAEHTAPAAPHDEREG